MTKRYVCEEYETPYEEGYRRICSIEEHDKQIRAEVIEQSVERVDRLMINTVCNPLIATREKIDAYLQCIRDAKKAIRGESDDN